MATRYLIGNVTKVLLAGLGAGLMAILMIAAASLA